MLPVESPFKTYTSLDGRPLNGGYIYFGQAGQNPVTAPVTVYWDAAGTQPAAQPLRTVNGYIARNGTPANVYVSSTYSELAQDSRRRQIFYASDSSEFAIGSILAGSGGAGIIGWLQSGVGAVFRWVLDKLSDQINIKDFGASPSATATANAAAINAALIEAARRGGDIVRMSGGTYQFNGTITIPSRCKLQGVSIGYGVSSSTVLQYTGNGVAIQMGDNAGNGYYSKIQDFALKNSGTGTIGILLRATRLEIERVTVTGLTNTGFSDSGIKSDYSAFGTSFTHLLRNVYCYGNGTGVYLRQVNNAVLDMCFLESNGTNLYLVDSTNVVLSNGTVLEVFGPTAGVYPGAETATSACIEATNVNNLVVRDFYSEVCSNNATGAAIAQRFARLNNVVGGCIESGWIYGDGTSQVAYPFIDVQDATVKGLSIKNNNCFRMVTNGYIVGASGTGNLANLEIGNNTHTVNAFEHDFSWTPSLLIGGSAAGITGSFKGLWERHGSWITVSFTIVLTNKGAGAGVVTIGNLPLPMQPRLDAGMFIAGTLFMSNCQLQSTAMSMTRITTSGSTIALRYRLVASNNDSAFTDADLQNATELYGTITYPVEP